MDTSKENIKMCDCPEIQDRWEPKIGDVTNYGIITKIDPAFHCEPFIWVTGQNSWCRKEQLIWLPTQSQLQDMYCSVMVDGKHIKEALAYLACFNVLCEEIYEFSKKDCELGIKSMEQLWLAFVMWELHQKKWDGEKWVSEAK